MVTDEPEVQVNSKLVVIFEFLEFLEGPIRLVRKNPLEFRMTSLIFHRDHQLPKGINQILHSFMMATSAELNAQENIGTVS